MFSKIVLFKVPRIVNFVFFKQLSSFHLYLGTREQPMLLKGKEVSTGQETEILI